MGRVFAPLTLAYYNVLLGLREIWNAPDIDVDDAEEEVKIAMVKDEVYPLVVKREAIVTFGSFM